MSAFWNRLPVIIRAVLVGAVVASAGTLPWAALVKLNTTYASSIPWAVPVTAGYLWIYWKYVRGAWWPQSTSGSRRTNSRANPVREDMWGMAIFAGIIGLVAVVLLQQVMNRMVRLPQQQELDISQFPVLTVVAWVAMSAIVAGVVEETSFRGYMQSPIERRHGPVVAILLTGIFFGFAHFGHPEVTLILLPYYLAVAAVYGMLAYCTNSTLPSMLLHAGGNMLGAFDLFVRGRSEWQASATPSPLIWETGTDVSFWVTFLLFLVAAAAAVWAFTALSRTKPTG